MKNLLLSTGFAAALGVLATASAGAAPIATHGVVLAPAGATNVDCRTVTKTTMRNGVRRSVTSRECERDRDRDRYGFRDRERDRYSERRVYRDNGYRSYDRPRRPGFSINVR